MASHSVRWPDAGNVAHLGRYHGRQLRLIVGVNPSATTIVGWIISTVDCRYQNRTQNEARREKRKVIPDLAEVVSRVVQAQFVSPAAVAPHGDGLFELFAPDFVQVFRGRDVAVADFAKVPAAGFAK